MLAILPALALLCSSCRNLTSRQVLDPSVAVARLQAGGTIQAEVDRLAKPLVESGRDFGLVIGVITPGDGLEVYRYGHTGIPGDLLPPDTNALFQLGSVSKVFVASLLAILVQDGTLRYEDTVRSILPESVPMQPAVGELTLRELITHTSGLPREPVEMIQLRHLMNYLFTGENLYGFIDKEFLYAYLNRCELKPRSERHYEYSNIASGLLSHLIEVKTGRSIPDLVQERICGPLHMRDTVYTLSPEQRERLVTGHAGDQPLFVLRGSPMEAWDLGEVFRGPSGLYSTAHDLIIFARANLGLTGNPIEPVLADMHELLFQNDRDGVAYDWIVDEFDEGRTVITFKHGMVAGYSAYVGIVQDRKIGVVWLSNTFNWQDRIGHNLLLRLAGGLSPARTTPERIVTTPAITGNQQP